jgi:FkbM family methyltransferase
MNFALEALRVVHRLPVQRGKWRTTMIAANRIRSLQSVRLQVPGGAVYVDLRVSSAHSLINTPPEPAEQKVMAQHIQRGTVVLDIGAHWGYHSVFMASLGATVFAFEPCLSTLPSLRRTVSENPTITLREIALSDSAGETEFFIPADESSASLRDWRGQALSVKIQVARLDDVEVPSPAFIKCDVEGAEALVFQGGARTIAEHRPTILFEINPPAMRALGLEPLAALNALRSLARYEFARVTAEGTAPLSEANVGFCNVLATVKP